MQNVKRRWAPICYPKEKYYLYQLLIIRLFPTLVTIVASASSWHKAVGVKELYLNYKLNRVGARPLNISIATNEKNKGRVLPIFTIKGAGK